MKIIIIILYFLIFYIFALLAANTGGVGGKTLLGASLSMLYNYFVLFSLILILYLFIKNKIFYPSIIIKTIIFTLFLLLYFMIEQSIIKLVIYGIGDSGGLIRSNIMEDTFYQFQWYEVLFWNFIFSLHYPVYIYIFFKPFVNHLDKSIQKIKIKKSEKLKRIKSVISNRSNKT